MEIKRNKYLEMLRIRRHNGFVKVITGIRRCGKSYLMNDIFGEKLKEDGVTMTCITFYSMRCKILIALRLF